MVSFNLKGIYCLRGFIEYIKKGAIPIGRAHNLHRTILNEMEINEVTIGSHAIRKILFYMFISKTIDV